MNPYNDKTYLEKFFTDTTVEIPKEEWLRMREAVKGDKQAKKEFLTTLAEMLDGYPIPLKVPTWDRAAQDFKRLLVYKLKIESTPWPVRCQDIYEREIGDQTFGYSYAGLTWCRYFFYRNMYSVRHRKYRNVMQCWQDISGRRIGLAAALDLRDFLNYKTLADGFELRTYVATNFRPTLAKQIVNLFCPKGGTYVDFSAGFGARMAGFWNSNAGRYIGVDPNTHLRDPFIEMGIRAKEVSGFDRNWELITAPAEELDYHDLAPEGINILFTSPPYFNIERYIGQDTQCWLRYPYVDEWLEKFMFVTLRRAVSNVKKNGWVILNMSDSEYLREIRICNPTCDFLENEMGLKYRGSLKYPLSQRPGSNLPKGTKICEPIWVFQKS